MKFSTVTFTLLAAASTTNAYWWKPAPTPTTPGYPTYPTPTPTPSGSPGWPHKPDDDQEKPKHKQCLKTCFQEAPRNCAPGYTPDTIKRRGNKECHTCCKEGGGKEYRRNMGQVLEDA